jgi:hypothetical protein
LGIDSRARRACASCIGAIGWSDGLRRIEAAKKNSFQMLVNHRMMTVVKSGTEMGNVTHR